MYTVRTVYIIVIPQYQTFGVEIPNNVYTKTKLS